MVLVFVGGKRARVNLAQVSECSAAGKGGVGRCLIESIREMDARETRRSRHNQGVTAQIDRGGSNRPGRGGRPNKPTTPPPQGKQRTKE